MIPNEELIIRLITDDLVNRKLVNTLNAAGLNAGIYFLGLSDLVFKLLGLGEDDYADEVYEQYLELAAGADGIDITEGRAALDKLAEQLYGFLLQAAAGRPSK